MWFVVFDRLRIVVGFGFSCHACDKGNRDAIRWNSIGQASVFARIYQVVLDMATVRYGSRKNPHFTGAGHVRRMASRSPAAGWKSISCATMHVWSSKWMAHFIWVMPTRTAGIAVRTGSFRSTGYKVLRFLADDLAKDLDTVLDAVLQCLAGSDARRYAVRTS